MFGEKFNTDPSKVLHYNEIEELTLSTANYGP